MGISKEGGPLPLEWSSWMSWTNHYTCIPAWNAEQAAACFPTAMLATVTSVNRKTPMQKAHFVSMEERRGLSKLCL